MFYQTTTPASTNDGVRWNWVLLVAAALAFALKLALALNTYGTNDVITWERHLAKIKDDGALAWYRDGPGFAGQVPNHPPFVVSMLAAWDYLAHVSGLPFRFWLRFTSALADILSLLLIWKCRIAAGLGAPPAVLLLIALSPVSIMVSGFHGNTDPLLVSVFLLSIWLAESGRPGWLAGAAFGMAMNIKVVPILFAPAFLLYLRGTRRRIGFALAAVAVFLTGSLPYIAQAPALIIHRLFGYAPVTPTWGFAQIAVFLPNGGYEIYLSVGKAILLLIVLWASFWMNRRARKPALFLQCGFIAFLFLFWTPGFGVQYLAWLVPWSAGLDGRRLHCYYASSGAFLFMKYTWWSHGFPWFLANVFDAGPLSWAGALAIPMGLACWISVGAVAHKLKTCLTETPLSLPPDPDPIPSTPGGL